MTQLTATVREYAGRTVDLLAFDGMTLQGEALLEPTLASGSGALVTGIQKLAQRFLIELLTEQGTLDYALNRGTLLMTQFRSGVLRTSQDLFSAFSSAEVDVRNNLRLEEDSTVDPADERYGSAQLLGATLLGDTATLRIQLTSAAGESRTIIYPLRATAL